MGISIKDGGENAKLNHQLERARSAHSDSLEKLSSGQIFTSKDPRPSERALAEGLEFRLRSLASSKRNINDAVSLLQTAEGGLSEVNNMISRMKEIAVSASTTTVTDRERRYLFIEYEALHDEINRVATTTEFNGIPLLNGDSDAAPDEMIFRLDDPFSSDDEDDVNVIRFDGIKNVVATPEGLGLRSARDLLSGGSDGEGISIDDVVDLMLPEDDENYATSFDEAIETLSTQRAIYGGMQTRLQRAMDFVDVYQENIAAAKSKIADTDYASEVAKLTESSILMQATTGLLSQSNISAQLSLNLLANVLK